MSKDLKDQLDLLGIELNNVRIEKANALAEVAAKDREIQRMQAEAVKLAQDREYANGHADRINAEWKSRLRDTLVTAAEEWDKETAEYIAEEFDITLTSAYKVEARVTLKGTITFEVEATSEDDARSKVDDFDMDVESAYTQGVSDAYIDGFDSELNDILGITEM